MAGASKALMAVKAQAEEDRRAKISVARQMDKLADIEREIEELCKVNPGGRIDAGMVGALRLRTDIVFNLLKKKLPDLKAIELTGPEGGPISFDKSVIEVVHTKATDTSETATNSDRPEALE